MTKAGYGRKQDTDLRGLLGHVKEFIPYPRAKGNHWMFLSRNMSSKIIILYVHVVIFWNDFTALLLLYWLLFSCSVMSDSLQPHGLQHGRLPCLSPSPRVFSNSCPLSQWCHPTISSSVSPFSSHLQSFPASGSFPMSQLFTSGGQSIGLSALASVLPMNIQGLFPLG